MYGALNLPVKLVRTSMNDTNNDVLSSDSLLYMTSKSHVSVSTTTDLHVPFESLYSMTSFGFQVNSDFIFAAYNNLQCAQKASPHVIFCEVVVNKGGAWNKKKSIFIVLRDGFYFFNFHGTALNGQKLTMKLKTIVSHLWDNSVVEDSISRSVLLELKENDEIAVMVEAEDESESEKQFEMASLKGFLYSSFTENSKPAWSLHSFHESFEEDNLEYINFNRVHINIDSIYNFTSREVVVKEGGIYYVAYVINGIDGNTTVSLILNDKTMSIIKRPVTYDGDEINVTRERAVLLDLQKDDKLAVKVVEGNFRLNYYYSICSFTGFMIYAI